MRPSGTPMLTPRMIRMRRSWAGCALSSSSSGTGAAAGESVDCGAVVMTEMLVMVYYYPRLLCLVHLVLFSLARM